MKVVSKEIEMIAYFKKDGQVNPIRFKIDEENKCKVIKIEKVVDTKLERLCGNNAKVFTCQSYINGVMKIYEIKFIQETSRWILFKI